MTRLLVSVRSDTEARAAIAGGAEIIDVKEPTHGSLGRADDSVWQQVAAATELLEQSSGVAIPLSVALGELCELPEQRIVFPAGICFAKVGLAGLGNQSQWPERWLRWRAGLPIGMEAVAVAYADNQQANSPPPEKVLNVARAAGVTTLLIDTFDKSAGSLLELVPFVWLQAFCAQVQAAGMSLAIAGSLRVDQIPTLLKLTPQIIAVRAAACQAGRTTDISTPRVKELVQALATSGLGSLPGRSVKLANARKI